MKVLVIHGPNLNLLGEREPEIYGTMNLQQMNIKLKQFAKRNKLLLKVAQFNGEGELIDWIHKNRKWAQGVVINPGAYTHYSYAIRDAISGVNLPTVEVHLSDIKAREGFRKVSVIEPVCIKQISGLGWQSYIEGFKYLLERQKNGWK